MTGCIENELQPKEEVASVTRIPTPDVADKGVASTGLSDLEQPLLHGMESTASSNVARPAEGSSPGGCGSECDHVGFYYCKKCGKDLTPEIGEFHGRYNDSTGAARG